MEDGIYFEFFAVKDGVRYNAGIMSVNTATKILTKHLLDGVQEMIMGEQEESNA